MGEVNALEGLVQQGRLVPSVSARIGRHDVLVEAGSTGTSVYLIRGERVLAVRGNKGYREDVVAALLDAVDDLVDATDLGSTVRLRPIDVPGFALDRAALLGPGHTDFFKKKPPLADRGMQVIPVHRCEAVDGEECESFWPGVIGKNLGIRHQDWTREPVPRADVRRLDDGAGGPYRHTRNSRNSSKATLVRARSVVKDVLPGLRDGVRLSVTDVRGYDLRLHREWDRLCGTLQIRDEVIDVDIPRLSAWSVFAPLFEGANWDPAALSTGTAEPPEDMLELRVNDAERRRHDDQNTPASLDECLSWSRALARTDGNFLVFSGRSGGIVQTMWQDGPGSDGSGHDEPQLWLETPEPALGRSRGRHVTLAEAEEMITILARADRVAVDELGELEICAWTNS